MVTHTRKRALYKFIWSIPSWLWYACLRRQAYTGLTIVGLGIIYLTYSLITSPDFISSIAPETKGPDTPATPNQPEINLNEYYKTGYWILKKDFNFIVNFICIPYIVIFLCVFIYRNK
jgi:hypothetical protein